MASTIARITWYAIMILCAGCLLVLDIFTHDFTSISYIFLALAVVLVSPVKNTIALIKWLLAKEAKDEKEVKNVPGSGPQVKERVLTEEEKRELKNARQEAENKLKDLNASKNWERSHAKEAGTSKNG